MFIFLFYLIYIRLQLIIASYIETVSVSGCESCRIYLTCRHLTSIITVLEAKFISETKSNNSENTATEVNALSTFSPFRFPLREAFNKRCSGVNHCSFILIEDCPGADAWGNGTVIAKFVCISDNRVQRYCNTDIILPEPFSVESGVEGISQGFIQSPGYPRFYAGQRSCKWRIRAPPQQKIQITLLDISLTVDKPSSDDVCTVDRLEILEQDQVIYSTCRQQEPPFELLSRTDFLEVVLTSERIVNPLRGVLLFYTAVGCPTLPSPDDGFLVYRNDTAAEYSCCLGYEFADTGLHTKVVRCLGFRWDGRVPLSHCQRSKIIEDSSKVVSASKMNTEIIAPALLIVALFLINGAILFYIYKARQRNIVEFKAEELGSLQMAEPHTQNV